ncbi:MAG: DUF2911 domain-containing protein [Flavobacteriaceae bacterium]
MRIPKWLKVVGIVVVAIWLLLKFIVWPMMQKETKKISKEVTTTYTEQGYDLSVTYSSPSKKGRVIFGELVPYGAVWRTGANEPTTFTTTGDIKIIDKNLPAGTYSLWTIPGKETWKVIFNKNIPDWGVTLISGGKETTRDPNEDVIQVEVPARSLTQSEEEFTITFKHTEQLYLELSWDSTAILVPIAQ